MTSQERAAKLVRVKISSDGTSWFVHVCGDRVPKQYAEMWTAERCADEIAKSIASAIDAHVQAALEVGGLPGVELTAEQVQEIAERYAASTQGFWEAALEDDGSLIVYAAVSLTSLLRITDRCQPAPQGQADSDFIAAAHQDIPALLADRTRLMAILRDMQSDGLVDAWKAGYRQGQKDEQEGLITTSQRECNRYFKREGIA